MKENPNSEVHALLVVDMLNPRRRFAIPCADLLGIHRRLGVNGALAGLPALGFAGAARAPDTVTSLIAAHQKAHAAFYVAVNELAAAEPSQEAMMSCSKKAMLTRRRAFTKLRVWMKSLDVGRNVFRIKWSRLLNCE